MTKITDFAIQECARQNDLSLESVGNMVEAHMMAMKIQADSELYCRDELFSIKNIKAIGAIVKPQNEKGFRTTPVIFQNGMQGIHHSNIERVLQSLLDVAYEISPDDFYKEFENIHPFEDGNGRVGAILWNILKNKDYYPECPPNMF